MLSFIRKLTIMTKEAVCAECKKPLGKKRVEFMDLDVNKLIEGDESAFGDSSILCEECGYNPEIEKKWIKKLKE